MLVRGKRGTHRGHGASGDKMTFAETNKALMEHCDHRALWRQIFIYFFDDLIQL